MQIVDGNLVYSATDLVGFLECGHLTSLERAAVSGHLERPVRDDPVLDRITQRGQLHQSGHGMPAQVRHSRSAQVFGKTGRHHEPDVEQTRVPGQNSPQGDAGVVAGRHHRHRGQRVGGLCLGDQQLHRSRADRPKRSR